MAGNWTHKAGSNHDTIELPKNTTENDLSNLVGVTGVTHSINGEQLDVYEVDENTRIVIKGTLYHDPDKEILIIHHNNKGIPGATYNGSAVSGGASAFVVSGGNAYEKAYYYYGKEYTDAQTGRVTYSKGTGLIIAGDMSSVWHPTDAGLSGGNHNSFYVMRGGVVKLNRMISLGCRLDILKTTFVGNQYSRMLEMRNPIGDNNSPQLSATFDKIAILEPAKPYPINLDLQGGTIGEVTAGNNAWGENELRNLDLSKNTGPYDIGSDSSGTSHHQDWIIVNSETGTDVRKMWRDTRTNIGQRGVVIIKKEVSLNVKDGDGNAIEGAKVFVKDSPSPTARDTIFLASKSNTGTHSFTTPTLSNADVDGSGNLIYYYADPLEYDFTTDANGDTVTEKITTGVNAHEYNASDSSALVANGGPYDIPAFHADRWADDGSGNTDFLNGLAGNDSSFQPQYSDWDSDKFGGFYKVDRRGNGNTNADEFTFLFCSYGELLSNNTQPLKGLGELKVNWVLFDDLNIVDSKASVEAYTDVSTPQEFYDAAKLHLVNNFAGETSTIVTRAGNEIDAGSHNVHINKDASDVFAFDGSTITIKTDQFIGDIVTTGTTTVESDEVVVGDFGSIGVLPWEIKNIEATSRFQLYNITKGAEVVTQKLTGIAYNKSILLELMGHTYAVTLRHDGAFIGATSLEVIDSGSASSSWTLQSGVVQFNVGSSGVLGSALTQDDADIKVDLIQGHENNTVTATSTINSSEFDDEPIANNNGNIDISGSYNASEIAVNDIIRLRVTCVVGAEAMIPLVTTGVATTAGLNFSIDQQADTIYNTNAIDGSSISAWTADFTNTPMGVDLSESDGGASVQEIYAYIVYQQTTADGVDKWFNVVRAIDGSNYQIDQAIADIKIQNIGTVAVNISGGRIFRKDGASVLYAVDGDKPLTLDTGALVANIQPQMEQVINNNPKIVSINNNSKLIPGLL